MGNLDVQLFTNNTTIPASHPSVSVTVPPQYKIVGGGARVFYTGVGSLLTASYPSIDSTDVYRTWNAAAKDHGQSDPSTIAAYALAIYDPDDVWDVHVVANTSASADHPTASATLPSGYTLTGGGAFVYYSTGHGQLLTASFPESGHTWQASSKDHLQPDKAPITAFVIGMASKIGIPLANSVVHQDSTSVEFPTAIITPPSPAFTLCCGGALDMWTEPGNMLTGSYPDGTGRWIASGKDQIEHSPAIIRAYAVCVQTLD
jgi:hypothetical protein